MQFRTEIQIKKSDWNIGHKNKIVTVGSCFADCLGQKFGDYQFEVLSNPFGVIFNPVSLFHNLNASLLLQEIHESDIIEQSGRHVHYQYHSEISASSSSSLKERLNILQTTVKTFLLSSDYLVITLGTGFVYQLLENNRTVANCHKQSATLFRKSLLTSDQLHTAFYIFYDNLKKLHPTIRLIVTVSPVRHLKDSLELNGVSKALLRLFSHQLSTTNPESIRYFPAFELLNDDLRDYRFYQSDMIHPSSQAEEYIWQSFTKAYFSQETIAHNHRIADIIAGLKHRPLHPESTQYKDFVKTLSEKVTQLNATLPVPELVEQVAQMLG